MGNADSNHLVGGPGDDQLAGNNGADLVDGGPGEDTWIVVLGVGGYANLSEGIARSTWDPFFYDTLVGIENATGGSGRDLLIGDENANVLDGGAGGEDNLEGRGGDDHLIGSQHSATVSYRTSPSRVVVNLAKGTATGDGNDSLHRISVVYGSRFNDYLVASGEEHTYTRLYGLHGNDIIRPLNTCGVFDGGHGRDRLVLFGRDNGVVVDLNTDQLVDIDGGCGTQYAISFQDVVGTAWPDTLRGNRQANVMVGRGGDDFISGRYGGDHLRPGPGGDVVRGGSGRDSLFTKDGARDRGDAGTGLDTCRKDTFDVITRCP